MKFERLIGLVSWMIGCDALWCTSLRHRYSKKKNLLFIRIIYIVTYLVGATTGWRERFKGVLQTFLLEIYICDAMVLKFLLWLCKFNLNANVQLLSIRDKEPKEDHSFTIVNTYIIKQQFQLIEMLSGIWNYLVRGTLDVMWQTFKIIFEIHYSLYFRNLKKATKTVPLVLSPSSPPLRSIALL